ncbi:MAG: hypothetical protein AB7S26_42590 [Sandaracinaceae bacterium]
MPLSAARRFRRGAWVCACVSLLATTAHAQTSAPLRVHIESPHAGVVDGPLVYLEATVSDPTARHATLVVNGAAYDVSVEEGRVSQQIIAIPGNNRVALSVRSGDRTSTDSLTFRYRGDAMEMMILLTWPSEGEIIDLWVREPEGETVKWDHRHSESGGHLLDFSSSAIGFGSQAYVLPRARAGAFRIKLHYWGAYAEEDQRTSGAYQDLLNALDAAEQSLAAATGPRAIREATAERERARAALDRWASPAAPQTPVHAEVVLFGGTAWERRWRFDVTVSRVGELVTVGQVEISDDMIRAARMQASGPIANAEATQ